MPQNSHSTKFKKNEFPSLKFQNQGSFASKLEKLKRTRKPKTQGTKDCWKSPKLLNSITKSKQDTPLPIFRNGGSTCPSRRLEMVKTPQLRHTPQSRPTNILNISTYDEESSHSIPPKKLILLQPIEKNTDSQLMTHFKTLDNEKNRLIYDIQSNDIDFLKLCLNSGYSVLPFEVRWYIIRFLDKSFTKYIYSFMPSGDSTFCQYIRKIYVGLSLKDVVDEHCNYQTAIMSPYYFVRSIFNNATSVYCSPNISHGELEEVIRSTNLLPKVVHFSLCSYENGNNSPLYFLAMSNITNLDLSYSHVKTVNFNRFSCTNQLKELNLRNCTGLSSEIMEHISKMTNLVYLNLMNTVPFVDSRNVYRLSSLKLLKSLHLTCVEKSDQIVQHLPENIRQLSIERAILDKKELQSIENWKYLTFLDLRGSELTQEALEYMILIKSKRRIHMPRFKFNCDEWDYDLF